jgi:hypothetical protein
MYDPFVEPEPEGFCEECGANIAMGETHHWNCPHYGWENPDDEDNYDDDNLTERDSLYNH